MYNYNHLYYFYITVKSGSVTAAAKHLGISQPSLSGQLKMLEHQMNLKLFQRVGRQNHLTESGQLVYGHCRQMFEIAEAMNERLLERTPASARKLSIGITDEMDGPFGVEVIGLFLRNHEVEKRPRVNLISGGHEQLVEQLRFHEIEAMISEFPVTEPELVNLEGVEVPVVLACSHLRSAQEITPSSCTEWVFPSMKYKLRAEIDHYMQKKKLQGRMVFEGDKMDSVVRAVVDDIGVAFLPWPYVAREVQDHSLILLGPVKGYWNHRFYLACHQQNRLDSLILSLAKSFKQVCKEGGINPPP